MWPGSRSSNQRSPDFPSPYPLPICGHDHPENGEGFPEANENLEGSSGFEPLNKGFADLRVRPLRHDPGKLRFWRRRADSNCWMRVLQTLPLAAWVRRRRARGYLSLPRKRRLAHAGVGCMTAGTNSDGLIEWTGSFPREAAGTLTKAGYPPATSSLEPSGRSLRALVDCPSGSCTYNETASNSLGSYGQAV